MRTNQKFLTLLACFLPYLIGVSRAENAPPNVVLIFVDDLGYGDLSCYGATKIQTPNIDKLAAEGRKFTDAHSASAVCTPSRYALMTGEYPFRANGGKGVWGPAPVFSGLLVDKDRLTIADVFKNKGYSTAAFGKWHLGFGEEKTDWLKPLSPGPLDLGFDHYFGIPIVNSAPPYVYVEDEHIFGGDPADPLVPVAKGEKTTPLTKLLPGASQRVGNIFSGAVEAHKLYDDYKTGTLLAEKAVTWIKEHKEKPFFLYFPAPNIHHPFTPAKRFQGSSQAGVYGNFVQELDWMVGEITACLEKEGLTDNTLVIFTSDNGGMFNSGGQEAWKLGHEQNGELLGWKFGAWEGGHRVPFIAKWPGKIPAGTTSSQLLCNVDMLATFAALTGQEIEPAQLADSIDMLPALTGEPEKPLRTEMIISPRYPSNLSVRKGKWMFIGGQGDGGFTAIVPGRHDFGGPAAISFVDRENSDIENGKIKKDAPPAQLYDLENDLKQTRNLYDEYPEVVKEMKDLLKTYRSMASKNKLKKKDK